MTSGLIAVIIPRWLDLNREASKLDITIIGILHIQPMIIHRKQKQHKHWNTSKNINYILNQDHNAALTLSIPNHDRIASISTNNTLKQSMESNIMSYVIMHMSISQECSDIKSPHADQIQKSSLLVWGRVILSMPMQLRVDTLCWALVKWVATGLEASGAWNVSCGFA